MLPTQGQGTPYLTLNHTPTCNRVRIVGGEHWRASGGVPPRQRGPSWLGSSLVPPVTFTVRAWVHCRTSSFQLWSFLGHAFRTETNKQLAGKTCREEILLACHVEGFRLGTGGGGEKVFVTEQVGAWCSRTRRGINKTRLFSSPLSLPSHHPLPIVPRSNSSGQTRCASQKSPFVPSPALSPPTSSSTAPPRIPRPTREA